MNKLTVALLDRDLRKVRTMEISAEKQKAVAAAPLVTYQGKHYGYHRLTAGPTAEFIECDPPVCLD